MQDIQLTLNIALIITYTITASYTYAGIAKLISIATQPGHILENYLPFLATTLINLTQSNQQKENLNKLLDTIANPIQQQQTILEYAWNNIKIYKPLGACQQCNITWIIYITAPTTIITLYNLNLMPMPYYLNQNLNSLTQIITITILTTITTLAITTNKLQK